MKILFTGIFIVVLASVYIIRQVGYNPKPILTMKSSKYESLEVVGNGLFRRFFKEAQTINNFYIFCEPNQCEKIEMWKHFLTQSSRNNLEGRRIVLSEGLELNYNSANTGRTIHFYPIELKDKIVIANKGSIIFYMVNYFVDRSEININKECDKSNMFTDFDCLALNYSNKFYKKKYDKKASHVGMEQISYNKFVIYLN